MLQGGFMGAERKSIRNTYSEFLEFDLQEVVSKNIKRCIAESGLSIEQLCFRSNLSVATIHRLKAGQNLSFHSLCALAEALNKDWRVFFEEPMK